MFAIFLFLLAVGVLGWYGWYRGGAKLGLALAPVLICSIFLWIAGGIAYQIDMMRDLGLVWPALFLIIPGLVGGYALRFWLRKKLPDTPSQRDRVIGGVVGLFMGLVVTWLGLVYQTVWVASHNGVPSSFNMGVAKTLNGGFIRWVPGIGAGSDAVMNMVDIATAPEDVQREAARDLGLDRLSELPEMQAVVEDPEIQKQIESIKRGNMLAIWSLQKDKRVLDLLQSEKVHEILQDISLEDISEAVQAAKEKKGDDR